MRKLTLLFAAVTLACEPTTPANPVEPEAGPVSPDEEIMAYGAETERCGVPLDADSTGTSAYVIPHGDSLPKLWPATLIVEEDDTIRFRVAPQEGTLSSSNSVRSWSEPDWTPDCRKNGWGCTARFSGLNPLYPDHLFDLWPEGSYWRQFNNGDYSNKTYEYVLTDYMRKVPLEGRKCSAQNYHCVGDEKVRRIKLDVGFRGGNAYGCHVMVKIVREGGIERGDTVLGEPEFTVYHDPGPTIAIYSTYRQSDAQRRRLEEGIQLLTAWGIQWDTLRHSQAAINFFAGTGDQDAVTPRFFLYDPAMHGAWLDPEPGVNNGGLRWLKRVVPPIGREMRVQRLRMREVIRLLEGRYYFTHEHHITRVLDGVELLPFSFHMSENWVTMQEMVDGLTGIEGTRLPRIFVGNPADPSASVGAHGGVRWLRRQLAGGP